MVPAIASPRNDDADLDLVWSGRISLTWRILAVNIFALALLAGGFFYLDSYRSRIVDSRRVQAQREVRLIADALDAAPLDRRRAVLDLLARTTDTRIRGYDAAGRTEFDSQTNVRNFGLVDPDKEPWGQTIGRLLDAMIDTVVGATRAPLYRERAGRAGLARRPRGAAHRPCRGDGVARAPIVHPCSPPPRR